MDKDDKTKDPGPPPSETEKPSESDKQIERLDDFFSSLQPGVTLLIERLKPSWCSGFLEEVQVSSEGIDLDYFIETWGGELLGVKLRGKRGRLQGGSYKIPLFSFPPLRYGEQLKPFDKSLRFRQDEAQPTPPAPTVVQKDAMGSIIEGLPALLPVIMKWMDSQEQKRQNDMAMMMNMMKGQQSGGLSDITQIGAVMAQLSELFQNQSSGGGGGGNDTDFLAHAMDVMKIVMDRPKTAQAPPPKARLTAPTGAPPTGAPPKGSPSKVTPLKPPQPKDLAGSIADLEPIQAAETLLEGLGRMSPDKRNQAVAHISSEYEALMSGFEGDEEEIFEDEDDTRGVK